MSQIVKEIDNPWSEVISPDELKGYTSILPMVEHVNATHMMMTGYARDDIALLRRGVTILYTLELLGFGETKIIGQGFNIAFTVLSDEEKAKLTTPEQRTAYEETIKRETNRVRAITLSLWYEDRFRNPIPWNTDKWFKS